MSVAKSSGKQTDSRTHQLKNLETWIQIATDLLSQLDFYLSWFNSSSRVQSSQIYTLSLQPPELQNQCLHCRDIVQKTSKLDIPHLPAKTLTEPVFFTLALTVCPAETSKFWLPSSRQWFWGTFEPTDLFLSPASVKVIRPTTLCPQCRAISLALGCTGSLLRGQAGAVDSLYSEGGLSSSEGH